MGKISAALGITIVFSLKLCPNTSTGQQNIKIDFCLKIFLLGYYYVKRVKRAHVNQTLRILVMYWLRDV